MEHLTLILLAFSLAAVRSLCPAGWVPGGLSCYKFVSKPLTWTEANGMCRELEGQLAVLDTAEKNAFITGYLHMKKELRDGIGGYWIGGKLEEGIWQWMPRTLPGDAMVFTNWANGQPDNAHEHCVETSIFHNLQWNDLVCTEMRQYLCERPASVCSSPDVVIG